ncbi:MAG TPA: FAD-dependent oxidoreductase [Anaerolineae bacterium]|nr:FAD-dependent oxidoreductase [Anaerolineae bacterium]
MMPGQQAHPPDSATPQPELANSPADHAVVIGSSIAGLMAARVLSEHFARVTVVERDWLPDGPAYRKGVPQAHHAHTLLPQGQMILEQQFPGLVDELLAGGAMAIDAARDIAFFEAGAWHTPRARDVKVSIACSRPLLENAIYHRVASRANVHIMPGYDTLGLRTGERRERVTGVRIRRRQAGAAEAVLAAELVVDASGRQLPRYLEGFVVCGDAAYALNPIYAQGMTAAATGSLVLDQCLQEQRRRQGAGSITGLAETYHKQLSKAVAGLWRTATRKDWDWLITEVDDSVYQPHQ